MNADANAVRLIKIGRERTRRQMLGHDKKLETTQFRQKILNSGVAEMLQDLTNDRDIALWNCIRCDVQATKINLQVGKHFLVTRDQIRDDIAGDILTE